MNVKIDMSLDLMKQVKNMDFGSALTFLKDGYLMRRMSWKKGYFIKLNDKTFVAYDTEYNERKHWNPEDYHLVAEDWEFYTDHMLDASKISAEDWEFYINHMLDASKISTGEIKITKGDK